MLADMPSGDEGSTYTLSARFVPHRTFRCQTESPPLIGVDRRAATVAPVDALAAGKLER